MGEREYMISAKQPGKKKSLNHFVVFKHKDVDFLFETNGPTRGKAGVIEAVSTYFFVDKKADMERLRTAALVADVVGARLVAGNRGSKKQTGQGKNICRDVFEDLFHKTDGKNKNIKLVAPRTMKELK